MEITFTINNSTSQKRKCNSKVRTGCATCKARHVKCDERKPCCDKCVSTGRQCPGYNVFRPMEPIITTKPDPFLRANPQPLLADATSQERLYFNKFQCHIVNGFCGIFDGSWWSPYVLKIAIAEPMILQATLALASANTDVSSAEHAFALKQYGKAVTGLQTALGKADDMNPSVLLLTCLLLACLGFAHNSHDEAVVHLSGGAAILSRIRDIGLQETTINTTEGAECCIVNAFRRLDLTTSMSMSMRPFPEWFTCWLESRPIVLDTMPLDHLAFLRNRLDRWITEVLCLLQDTQTMTLFGVSLFRHDYPVQIRVQEMIAASDQWLRAFNRVLTYTIPTIPGAGERQQAERAANLLRIHHRSASIMLVTTLADGRESAYDDHLDDFNAILDLAFLLAPHFQSKTSAFTLDVGIIPSLYHTICKCRHPRTRHRALDLLSSLTHREGAWDAQVSAREVRKIVKLEEDAAMRMSPGVELLEALDIPEIVRLYEPYFDSKTGGENLIYCKRRRFESHGDWIYWQEVVY